jgi:hypothetical protein
MKRFYKQLIIFVFLTLSFGNQIKADNLNYLNLISTNSYFKFFNISLTSIFNNYINTENPDQLTHIIKIINPDENHVGWEQLQNSNVFFTVFEGTFVLYQKSFGQINLPKSFTNVFVKKIAYLSSENFEHENISQFFLSILKIQEVLQDNWAIISYNNPANKFEKLFSAEFAVCLACVAYGENGIFLGHFSDYDISDNYKTLQSFKDIIDALNKISTKKIILILNPDFVEEDLENYKDKVTKEKEKKELIKQRNNAIKNAELLKKFFEKKFTGKGIEVEIRFFDTKANIRCPVTVTENSLLAYLLPKTRNNEKIDKMKSKKLDLNTSIDENQNTKLNYLAINLPNTKKEQKKEIVKLRIPYNILAYEIFQKVLNTSVPYNYYAFVTNPQHSLQNIIETIFHSRRKQITREEFFIIEKLRTLNFCA